MPKPLRTVLVWLAILVVFTAIYVLIREPKEPVAVQPAAVFFADIEADALVAVEVDRRQRIYATRKDRSVYRVDLSYTLPIYELLKAHNIEAGWWQGEAEETGSHSSVLLAVLGGLVVVVAVAYFLRKQQGKGMSGVFQLRRSTARLVVEVPSVSWDDVGGANEAKERLRDAASFLKDPGTWQRAGARAPRGILLEGPPGFGKTLLAKALASEAKLPFFEVAGSEFVELFVGVGASRVRDLFEEARKKAPAIVFIDEIDAVGRKRGGAAASLTHQEREQALDQLLACLDGFGNRGRILVVAATNRADVLDPALLRPGRFDVVLKVGEFDARDRLQILRIHSRNKPLGADISLEQLARDTDSLSGADLEQLLNDAALSAAKRAAETSSGPEISSADIQLARSRRGPSASGLNRLDTFLAAASTGTARPLGRLSAELWLSTEERVVGPIEWADPLWIKLTTSDGPRVVNREHVLSLRAGAETEAVDPTDLLRVPPQEQPDVA